MKRIKVPFRKKTWAELSADLSKAKTEIRDAFLEGQRVMRDRAWREHIAHKGWTFGNAKDARALWNKWLPVQTRLKKAKP